MRALWTDDEVSSLKEMAEIGFNAYDIARALNRPPSSIYCKARKLGTDLVFRIKRYPYPAGDRSTWDEAQQLCAFANVPMPLARLVTDTCAKHNLSVRSVRSCCRLQDHYQCRIEIATQARRQGYSLQVIGRAINRDHSTVLHSLRRVA